MNTNLASSGQSLFITNINYFPQHIVEAINTVSGQICTLATLHPIPSFSLLGWHHSLSETGHQLDRKIEWLPEDPNSQGTLVLFIQSRQVQNIVAEALFLPSLPELESSVCIKALRYLFSKADRAPHSLLEAAGLGMIALADVMNGVISDCLNTEAEITQLSPKNRDTPIKERQFTLLQEVARQQQEAIFEFKFDGLGLLRPYLLYHIVSTILSNDFNVGLDQLFQCISLTDPARSFYTQFKEHYQADSSEIQEIQHLFSPSHPPTSPAKKIVHIDALIARLQNYIETLETRAIIRPGQSKGPVKEIMGRQAARMREFLKQFKELQSFELLWKFFIQSPFAQPIFTQQLPLLSPQVINLSDWTASCQHKCTLIQEELDILIAGMKGVSNALAYFESSDDLMREFKDDTIPFATFFQKILFTDSAVLEESIKLLPGETKGICNIKKAGLLQNLASRKESPSGKIEEKCKQIWSACHHAHIHARDIKRNMIPTITVAGFFDPTNNVDAREHHRSMLSQIQKGFYNSMPDFFVSLDFLDPNMPPIFLNVFKTHPSTIAFMYNGYCENVRILTDKKTLYEEELAIAKQYSAAPKQEIPWVSLPEQVKKKGRNKSTLPAPADPLWGRFVQLAEINHGVQKLVYKTQAMLDPKQVDLPWTSDMRIAFETTALSLNCRQNLHFGFSQYVFHEVLKSNCWLMHSTAALHDVQETLEALLAINDIELGVSFLPDWSFYRDAIAAGIQSWMTRGSMASSEFMDYILMLADLTRQLLPLIPELSRQYEELPATKEEAHTLMNRLHASEQGMKEDVLSHLIYALFHCFQSKDRAEGIYISHSEVLWNALIKKFPDWQAPTQKAPLPIVIEVSPSIETLTATTENPHATLPTVQTHRSSDSNEPSSSMGIKREKIKTRGIPGLQDSSPKVYEDRGPRVAAPAVPEACIAPDHYTLLQELKDLRRPIYVDVVLSIFSKYKVRFDKKEHIKFQLPRATYELSMPSGHAHNGVLKDGTWSSIKQQIEVCMMRSYSDYSTDA